MSALDLDANFFRHEYGRLVAVLSRRAGVQHLEAVEDAVQNALTKALETWTTRGLPDAPSAWLFRVANNALLDELRQGAGHRRILAEKLPVADEREAEPSVPPLAGEIRDDMLRMLLLCCASSIPRESQLALALKTLCGFDVREIALRLFTSEANVYKRLGRAREELRGSELRERLDDSLVDGDRIDSVCQVLYLMFTEGFLSSHESEAIRRELCDEAIRLGTILVEHPRAQRPEAMALLALMHLHRARMAGRTDASGGLLLLEDQDRSQWSPEDIHIGLHWLGRSANGDAFTRFHAEAGVAAEHCVAPSFEETRWERVVECYELLDAVSPTPSALHRLNRAVALAEWQGPEAGLALLEAEAPPSWLAGSYLWSAVLADLHRRCGHRDRAAHYRECALRDAPSAPIRQLLERRLGDQEPP